MIIGLFGVVICNYWWLVAGDILQENKKGIFRGSYTKVTIWENIEKGFTSKTCSGCT